MKNSRHVFLIGNFVFFMLLTATGCAPDYRDQRLADFAQRSTAEQAQQNTRIANQAEAVVVESQQLVVAAKELVTRDAEARRELISAHAKLNEQLQADQQQLEQDRRDIAQQRHRDPIIAAVLQSTGILLACLLPLLVALLVIRQMQHQEPDHAAVAELLIHELINDRPLFLLASSTPPLTASSRAGHQGQLIGDSAAPPDFPF